MRSLIDNRFGISEERERAEKIAECFSSSGARSIRVVGGGFEIRRRRQSHAARGDFLPISRPLVHNTHTPHTIPRRLLPYAVG